MSLSRKPTLCIDFDGVIHNYYAGWRNGEIYGDIVPGFFEWCMKVKGTFTLAVYSSRTGDDKLRSAMVDWLREKQMTWWNTQPGSEELPIPFTFEFPLNKPAAWITIDDRCIHFDGRWDSPELTPDALLAFVSWTNS